jgi:serine/threonine-protein kinase
MKFCPTCSSEYDDSVTSCPQDGTPLALLPDPTPAASGDPMVGAMFTDRIRIDTKIGEGGMGSVYKGQDVLLGRDVAVKVLLADLKKNPDDVKRFFNEAKVVAKLRHPNTIQVFDFGESADGQYYIAMEYMTGEPLDEHLQHHQLSLGRVFEIAEQVCLSLEEAHDAGIVHRDLKPENIFIDTVGNRRLVKVIDFGIAKLLTGGENLTQAGMVFGTPAYMSPEQARGDQLDGRSDIYALGCVMFTMLTGDPPFLGETPMEVAVKHITETPPKVTTRSRFDGLPESLVQLIDSLLAKDREARPENVTVVRRRLVDIARELPGLHLTTARETGAMVRVETDRTMNAASGDTATAPAAPVRGGLDPTLESTEAIIAAGAGRSTAGRVAVVMVLILCGIAGLLYVFVIAPGQDPGDPASDASTEEPLDEPIASDEPAENEGPDANNDAASVRGAAGAAREASVAVRIASAESALAARAQVVTLRINSEPSGATVRNTATDETIGETPVEYATRRADDETATFALTLDGYVDASIDASLARSADVRATLQRPSTGRSTATTTQQQTSTTTTTRTPDPPPVENPPSDDDSGGRRPFQLRDPVTIPTDE